MLDTHVGLEKLLMKCLITDPCISGHPLVYASSGFLKMFDHSKDDVVGRNGRMFQGPKTKRSSVLEIREAIREEGAIETSLSNYRKDGTPYWTLFHLCPVFSKEDGGVIHFVGVQVPILRRKRLSGFGIVRNGMNVYEDGAGICEAVFRCCRREVCSDSVMELGRALALNSAFGSDYGGYARHELLGRNYRLLSGLDMDSATRFQIKESIRGEQACTKGQSSFWNFLHISPGRNAKKKVSYFSGIQINDICSNRENQGSSPEMRQLSAVAAIKVAVRSLSMGSTS